MRFFLREILGTIALAIVIFVLLHFAVQSFIVIGSSMENSFHDQQRLLIIRDRVTYAFHEPERGDVIIFHPPGNQRGDYIKRIIGLPGDTVEIKMGSVYVNDTKLDEPYIKDPPNYTYPLTDVPEDNYFVLGDNRNISSDSHNGWMLPRQNIIGRVWLSIWPPDRWEVVPKYSLAEQPAGS